MRKYLLAFCVLLLIFVIPLAADESAAEIQPLVDKGSLIATAGLGWGGLSGGLEWDFAGIRVGGFLPFTFGAAARAFIDPGIFYTVLGSGISYGIGAFGTVHFGLKALTMPDGFTWFSNTDWYAGLGIGFAGTGYSGSDYTVRPGIGISTFEGVNYFLNGRFAINLEYGYLGRVNYSYSYYGYYWSSYFPLYYASIGVLFKI